jgi:predicted permease
VIDLRGVKAATVATHIPFVSGASWDLAIDGYVAPNGERFLDVTTNQVGPGYFATMQTPVVQGREFTEKDSRKFPNVVVVNEAFARNYLTPEGNFEKALGRIVRLRDGGAIQVVGVVKDSNYGGPFGVPANPVFYTPYFQQAATQGTLVIRADERDFAAIVPAVRQEISALDTGIAPVSIKTMTQVVSTQGLFLPRIVTLLSGAFGLVALSLAFIGLYGVVSFMAARRTQEIGIRMTLGAQRGAVLRMILGNGLVLAGIGLVFGLGGAAMATPLMREMLVGVSPWDPATYVVITLVLTTATVVASWIPANRATRVDPMTALRYE